MSKNKNNSVVVQGVKGKVNKRFDSLEDAYAYIDANNLPLISHQQYNENGSFTNELPELVVTKKRSELSKAADRFEETFGLSPKDAASMVPFVGEAIDTYDIQQALRNKEYFEAGLIGAGYAIPNIIEKPAKWIGRSLKKVLNGRQKISLLDWSTWSKGGPISDKHLKEYASIERKTKANGTYMKNIDGTDFVGDPHTWIQMQSEDFKKHWSDEILYSGISKGREINPTYMGEQWATTSRHRARTYANNDEYVEELTIPLDAKVTTFDAKNRNWRAVDINSNGNYITTNDIRDKLLKENEVLRIQRVNDPGPRPISGDKKSSRYSKYYSTIEDDAFYKRIEDDNFYDTYTEPDNVVLGEGLNRKSLLYNNGDFNPNNFNKYMGIIPIGLGGMGLIRYVRNTNDK